MSAVYVAVGSKGLLKVGMSDDPKKRLSVLKRDFRMMGEEIVSSYKSEKFSDAWSVEQSLIRFLREQDGSKVAHGREYFRGVDASACIEKAKSLAAEAIRLETEERDAIRNAKKKREDAKQRKLDDLKRRHFAEFIELQKLGQLPIPEVTTKEPK